MNISESIANLQYKLLQAREKAIDNFLRSHFDPTVLIRPTLAIYRDRGIEYYFLIPGDVEIEGTSLEEAKSLYPYLEISYETLIGQ